MSGLAAAVMAGGDAAGCMGAVGEQWRLLPRLLGQGGAERGEGRWQEKRGRGVEGFYPELFWLKIGRIHLPFYIYI